MYPPQNEETLQALPQDTNYFRVLLDTQVAQKEARIAKHHTPKEAIGLKMRYDEDRRLKELSLLPVQEQLKMKAELDRYLRLSQSYVPDVRGIV